MVKTFTFLAFVLLLGGVAVALAAACSSSSTPTPTTNDGGGTSDGGTGQGEGGATPRDAAPGEFGAACDAGAQCQSTVCFQGGNQSFCSLRCDASAACPTPPTTGQCNNQGYCK